MQEKHEKFSNNEKKVVDFDDKIRIKMKLKKSSLKIPKIKINMKIEEENLSESEGVNSGGKSGKKGRYIKNNIPFLTEETSKEIFNSIIKLGKDLEFLSYRAYAFNKFKSEEVSTTNKSILKTFIGEENLNKIIGEQNNGFYFSQKRTLKPILNKVNMITKKNHTLHTQENESDIVKLLDNKYIDSEYSNSYDFLGNYNLKQLSKASLFNETKLDSVLRLNSKSSISRNFNAEKEEIDKTSSRNRNFSTNTNSQNFDVKDSFIIKEKNNLILKKLNSQDSSMKDESKLKQNFISKFAKMIGIKEVIEEYEKNTGDLNKRTSIIRPVKNEDHKDIEFEIKSRRLNSIVNEQQSMFNNIKMIEKFEESNVKSNHIEHNEVKRDLNNKLKFGVETINSKTKNIAKLIFSKIKKNLIKKSSNKLIDLSSVLNEEIPLKSDNQAKTTSFSSTLVLPEIKNSKENTVNFVKTKKSMVDFEPIKEEQPKKKASKYLVVHKTNSTENVEKYIKAHENEQKRQIINNLSDYASEKKLIIELETFKQMYETIKSKQIAYAERYSEVSNRYSNMLLDKEKDLILIEKLKLDIEKLDFSINNFGKQQVKIDRYNNGNKLDVMDLFAKRKEFTLNLEEIENKIKSNQGFIKVSLFMKESYALDINKLESELEEISENINIISIKICSYYYKIMSIGIDMRENGIIWLFKEIWKLGYDIILSKIPKFMDKKLVEYCFIYAHKENVLNSCSSLKEDVVKIIANLKGIEIRVTNYNKRFQFTKKQIKKSYKDFVSGKYVSPSESGSIQDPKAFLKLPYRPVVIENNNINSLNHKSISGLFFNYESTLTKNVKASYDNTLTNTPSIFINYLTSFIDIDKKTTDISNKIIEDIQISRDKEMARMSNNFLNKNYGKIYQTNINQIFSIICGSKNIRKELKSYEEKSQKVKEEIKLLRFHNL